MLVMEMCVGQKIFNLIWMFMVGICQCLLECGIKLLLVVFVGLNNLLGCYVLCFVYGNGEYFIYGISVLDSVGLCVSLGCIRMNVLDIKVLFFSVWMGMLVKVINELVKYFVEFNGMCYVEVY